MQRIRDLANFDDVVKQLADELLELDVEHNPYETDLYLYIDEDGIGKITESDTDEAILIHTDKGSPMGPAYAYETIDELCIAIGEAPNDIAEENGEDPEGLEFRDYAYHIEKHYREELLCDLRKCAGESLDYEERAILILNDFEKEQERRKDL